MEHEPANPQPWFRRHAGLIGVNVICLATLLPFFNKPFHIDDPMYLWAAPHIRERPLDFYGFDVNWYVMTNRMYDVNKNPPGVSYYLAGASLLLGGSELAMRAALLLPALGLATGTYLLARRMCDAPFVASAAATLAPVILVSATTVMSDILMLCLFVWSVYLWVRGIDEKRGSLLVIACVLAGLAPLTKYFDASLVPRQMLVPGPLRISGGTCRPPDSVP